KDVPGLDCKGCIRFYIAKAVYQAKLMLTDPPPSRASPLPHWICASLGSCKMPGVLKGVVQNKAGLVLSHISQTADLKPISLQPPLA
ncbi:MAG: hypothetical protein AAAB17_26430, partial [Pseudomonas sp.]